MKAQDYINELMNILSHIEVVDINNTIINTEDGIENVILLIQELASKNKKIIIIGNGGSSSIAQHASLDFWNAAKIKAISFNDSSMLTCMGNDYGYENVFVNPVRMFAEKDDMLIAISSSGSSRNILAAVDEAKIKGCKVVTLSGFAQNNPLKGKGDYNIYVNSGKYGYVEVAHQVIMHMITDMAAMATA